MCLVTQTRKEQILLRNEPWHCLSHSQRPWSGFAHRTSYSANTHKRAHRILQPGVKKAWSHDGGKGGCRQHLQSPLLIALLPAWSQITGLEMLQSGLYLLASLPRPQIRTSKPPSYHLLVNLQQRKRTPWYSEVKLLLSISSFFFVGISYICQCLNPPQRFGTPTTAFLRTWKDSGQCISPPHLCPELLLWCKKTGVTNLCPFTVSESPLTQGLAEPHMANDLIYFN